MFQTTNQSCSGVIILRQALSGRRLTRAQRPRLTWPRNIKGTLLRGSAWQSAAQNTTDSKTFVCENMQKIGKAIKNWTLPRQNPSCHFNRVSMAETFYSFPMLHTIPFKSIEYDWPPANFRICSSKRSKSSKLKHLTILSNTGSEA